MQMAIWSNYSKSPFLNISAFPATWITSARILEDGNAGLRDCRNIGTSCAVNFKSRPGKLPSSSPPRPMFSTLLIVTVRAYSPDDPSSSNTDFSRPGHTSAAPPSDVRTVDHSLHHRNPASGYVNNETPMLRLIRLQSPDLSHRAAFVTFDYDRSMTRSQADFDPKAEPIVS